MVKQKQNKIYKKIIFLAKLILNFEGGQKELSHSKLNWQHQVTEATIPLSGLVFFLGLSS